ncbi:MAG: N-acyl-D-aspartate/D-glutamate deacylase [Patescibacteria group bacterium]
MLNPETLKANATYTAPRSISDGVTHLWVNGKLVIKEGAIQDGNPGRVLTLKKQEANFI